MKPILSCIFMNVKNKDTVIFCVLFFFSLLFKRFLKLKLMYTGICDIDDLKDNSNKRPSDLIFIKVPF